MMMHWRHDGMVLATCPYMYSERTVYNIYLHVHDGTISPSMATMTS